MHVLFGPGVRYLAAGSMSSFRWDVIGGDWWGAMRGTEES